MPQNRCSKCGEPGHKAKTCGREGAAPAVKKKRAAPSPALHAAAANGNGAIASHIRGLVQAVAAGKTAEAELAAIRDLLGA